MKNFQRIAENVPTMPVMHALQRHPDLWDQNTLRTQFEGSPHAQVHDIWLLFNSIEQSDESIANDCEVVTYPAWFMLPEARKLAIDLMQIVGGRQLGRVMITKLEPGKKIPEHRDEGAPATFFQRYQVALQSLTGVTFQIDDEAVVFATGEIWWIDNTRKHSVKNNSADDRVVMIVDVRID